VAKLEACLLITALSSNPDIPKKIIIGQRSGKQSSPQKKQKNKIKTVHFYRISAAVSNHFLADSSFYMFINKMDTGSENVKPGLFCPGGGTR
jgi:hypothetical protein